MPDESVEHLGAPCEGLGRPVGNPVTLAASGSGEVLDPLALLSGRRAFLAVLGGLALVGCSSPERVTDLPEPIWPADVPPPQPTRLVMPRPASTGASGARPAPSPEVLPGGVIPRERWAKGSPDYRDMEPMLPVGHITLHHDALSPFLATDAASSQARLELIRSAHRNKHWADIGYHYVIDRAGRIYEARPVKWQGAHVKEHNEGNIGILCMGNFEVQSPSEQQMNALVIHVRTIRAKYRVPPKNVLTHREWKGAQTLCPGVNMQRKVATMRSGKAWA